MHIKILDKKGDFQGYIKGISIFYNRVDTTPYTNEAKTYNNKDVQELLKKGYSWSKMWITFGQKRYNYDNNFTLVSNYIMNNKITKK